MGREDQQEEKETLKSIFPDEIADISEDSYRISVTLDVSHHGEDYSDPPILILQVTYPEDYPDVAPRLEISAPPNSPKYPHFDIQEDRDRLLDLLTSTVEENLGMAMVFTLVDILKEGAELLVSERHAAVEAQKEVEAAKAEEEENRKFQGEAVTRDSFLAWREKFRREMEEEEKRKQEEKEAEEKRKRGPKEPKKPTGKQLWESGLAGKGDYDEDESLPAKFASASITE
ncbi:Protein gir2 [Ophidiomyces ophidiicola]|uniref:Protein gir2 n=1 Tax=Ophidiomyces ophidiicola TaxID=1387563 RepID=UPI0020C31D28|nr:Protein gir2 [Ophidiomyces ophidiicola]KAI1935683.1 Protein gir2 [Ophidiomyces ophidiicola]KAI1946824.1 Protein gir2 [Ophidiomyces ophidiicola]KAI1973742.1 Protein gir2 [Ophidiomyces ophidiicola]KAI1985555.1 Protein gir2 [Ophidiomyces ophidiicola]KAI1996636.1 Protein gir2 [Ophidiomyces ophidiicola]